jgi:hypothetical protein
MIYRNRLIELIQYAPAGDLVWWIIGFFAVFRISLDASLASSSVSSLRMMFRLSSSCPCSSFR